MPVTAIGVGGYIGLMAAGYAYNLTFVQLGLTAFARERLGLTDTGLAVAMGALAIGTCLMAMAAGWTMRGWATRPKLMAAAAAVASQTVLTAILAWVTTPAGFAAWLVVAALALGTAVPATFGLATDLVPVRQRGTVAAAITSIAYGGSIAVLGDWDALELARRLVPAMALGSVGLTILALAPGLPRRIVNVFEAQARDRRFADGRFAGSRARGRMLVAAALLFGIFFVDSLGFVRLADSAYIGAAWQSPDLLDRSVLIGAHVAGALAAGALYATFDERLLMPWIFGVFVLVALLYVADVRADLGGPSQVLAMPVLYAVGVSLYTVLTFALWADLSTPRTITWFVAIGVALSAWTATFFSTALALVWRTSGLDLDEHLSAVAAIGLLVLGGMWLLRLLRPASRVMP